MNIDDYILSEQEYNEYINTKINRTKYKISKSKNGEMIEEEKEYILSYEEYKESITMAIMQMFLKSGDNKVHKEKDIKPISLIIVAPPGAGKTGVASYEEMRYKEETGRGIVKIDPDEVGLYHKKYTEIHEEIPNMAFFELQKFIRPALNTTIRDFAVNCGVDLIQEGTFGDTQGYKEIIKKQLEKGYDVRISTIAVPKIEALMSCAERLQHNIEIGLMPRIVDIDYFNKVSERYLETLRQVEKEKLYSKIKVYRRGEKQALPILVYESGDNRYRSVIEAIQDEQAKGLDLIFNTKEMFQSRIDKLRERIINNPNLTTQKTQLEQLEYIQQEFNKLLEERESGQEEKY